SGSLITARLAADSGREVFAIPGSIHSPLSRGCHRLIRDGAKLVEMATDILEELQLDGSAMARPTEPPAVTAPAADDDPAAALLANLGHDPVDLDTLAARSGLTVDALYAILLPMELDGRIARLPGGRFQRR
ncbi:MAG TPA: DNA-processing protein DprA, partial [Pseudothauera hydrothermalis]|nr:DNA-processing protein DprA [Pseudothauera hydrothermalis]